MTIYLFLNQAPDSTFLFSVSLYIRIDHVLLTCKGLPLTVERSPDKGP